MKLLGGLLVMAIFVAQCSSSAPLRTRRQAEIEEKPDSGVTGIFANIFGFIEEVPIAGTVVKAVRTRIRDLFEALQNLTNGGFARVLGGTLPCEISAEGFKCTGLTRGHHFTGLFVNVLKQIPVLPTIIVDFISNVLEDLADPALDIVLGGIYTKHT